MEFSLFHRMKYHLVIMHLLLEELGGRAVSTLSVRSQKLSIVRRGQSLDG
jgi:hypothetical protein